MLSKHPERCRYPHGHSRRIEIVVSSDQLNSSDMVVDFKALKLAISDFIDRFDHSMALNESDPLRESMEKVYPGSVVSFDRDPTTEVLAQTIFEFVKSVLDQGFSGFSEVGAHYQIAPLAVQLDRVRVWETESSWAEFGS